MYLQFGKIKATHGLEGVVKVKLLLNDFNINQCLDFIFIDIDKTYVPYKILNVNDNSNTTILLKLKNINNTKDASEIIGHDVYIECENINDCVKLNDSLLPIFNYKVYNRDSYIGIINDIKKYPAHYCLEVTNNENSFLIPYVKPYIKDIKEKEETIILDCPDNLFN